MFSRIVMKSQMIQKGIGMQTIGETPCRQVRECSRTLVDGRHARWVIATQNRICKDNDKSRACAVTPRRCPNV